MRRDEVTHITMFPQLDREGKQDWRWEKAIPIAVAVLFFFVIVLGGLQV